MDTEIINLIDLAAKGLIPMFDAEKKIFCYRIVESKEGLVREGISPRYTIMTLLGLLELERSGGRSSFDIKSLFQSFVSDTKWIRSGGDLGLLLWLYAAFAADEIQGLVGRFHLADALKRFPDTREDRTMELAWFLAGLAHAAEVAPKSAGLFMYLARETYGRLKENQGSFGLFGHINTRKSLAGRLRGRIGSFADQIYPIYAFSKMATTFHMEEPLASANKCAEAICRAQGNMGQWWWLYDSVSGRVSSRYPVYSVHQHGMAPMGLFALEEAGGKSFREPIYKGLRWIYGNNEMGLDMRDTARSLIWRCVLPKEKRSKYLETALSLVRPPAGDAHIGELKILFEDRPYELGWLLFAFSKHSVRPAEVTASRSRQ